MIELGAITPSETKEILTWIVLAGAVVTALGTLHVKLIKPAIGAVQSAVEFFKELQVLVPTLQQMAAEFQNNHGSSLRDVVDRIEDSLTRNRDLGRMLLSANRSAHFEADAHGRCTWVNDAYLEMTGFRFEDCLGFGWYNAIDQQDRPVVAKEWAVSAAEGKDFLARYHLFTSGHEQKPVICKAVFSRNTAGAVIGAVGTIAFDATAP